MNTMRGARGILRSALASAACASALVAALASCSALLDFDLSGNDVGADGGPRAPSDEGGGPGGEGGSDGASGPDGGDAGGDTGGDAALPIVPLDCSGALLCDGFEGRADAQAPHWDQVYTTGGTVRIATETAAQGTQSLLFTSPASPSGATTLLLLGGGGLGGGGAGATLTARMSAYVWLDYDPTQTGGGVRQVIGLRPSSTLAGDDQLEYAGITLGGGAATAPYAEIRTYGAGSPGAQTAPKKVPLGVDLRGGWHHVVVDAAFSTFAEKNGRLVVTVDGVKRADVTGLGTWAQQTTRTFVAWIGTKAVQDTPQLTARFDNVEVRGP